MTRVQTRMVVTGQMEVVICRTSDMADVSLEWKCPVKDDTQTLNQNGGIK